MIKKTAKKTKSKIKTPIEKISSIKLDMNKIGSLYSSGLTDQQIADFLGITRKTLHNWCEKSKELTHLKKDWKAEADVKVEKSLYQRALGYKFDETTQEIKDGELKLTKIITKEVAADVTACIFWLKNRKPQEWRDRQEIDLKTYKHDAFKDTTDEELDRKAVELANRILSRRTRATVN